MTVGNQSAAGYAIAIGINQYEHFQPLNYAVRDAQALKEFLTTEAQVSSDRVLLLTDTSSMVEQGNTSPNRANIEAALTYIARKPQANDFLWVFFSGYGVQVDGQDYWMPIEGDPKRVRETGVAIAKIFSILQNATTRNVLLLLDMNRSQSAIAESRVGGQTAAIAAQTGIPTILSSAQNQFAHETLALRHGLFTAVLLEGLRYGDCTTIDHLVQFLNMRLPELSEHHWRPRQEPLAIVPAGERYRILLPRPQLSTRLDAAALPDNGKQPLPAVAAIGNGHSAMPPITSSAPPIAISSGLSDDRPLVSPNPSTAVVPVSSPRSPGEDEEDSRFWRSLLLLGGLLFGLLFLGVLFQNRNELTKAPSPEPTIASPATVAPTTATNSPTATPTPATPTPTGGNAVVAPPASPTPAPTTGSAAVPPRPIASRPPVAVAPATTSPATLNAVRATLDRSIAASPNTQISAFSRAIAQARKIPKTDPTYAQAQQDIDRWSQLILRVAEQRANQGNGGSRRRAIQNYRSAIAAARLVPRDRPAVYARAQRLIAFCNRQIR